MAAANTVIQLKKSGVSGNIPATLNVGETALNYADGKLYYLNATNSISYITNQQTFSTINVNSTLILAGSPTDILSITGSNGVTITANTTTKTINIDSSVDLTLANNAYNTAQAAYNQANSSNVLAQQAYNQANNAISQALAFAIALG
jgi:hypothetical protein